MTSLLLGWRLATSPASRLRSGLTLVATLIAALLLMTVAAIARAELATSTAYYTGTEMNRLLLAIVVTITIPIGVLVATVSRLSAATRDRRLASLRLVGLTPHQTRAVAVAETASLAVIGTVLGWAAFWLVRPLLTDREIGGRSWTDAAFTPSVVDQLLVLLAVPGLVAVVGVLGHGGKVQTALSRARRADRKPPSPWRALPLAVGVAICLWIKMSDGEVEESSREPLLLLAGIALTGLGLVVVVPVFVRFVAAIMLRTGGRPATRIAGRRLEAQPAGVARVVAVLLIGLFVVTGARFVIAAFENTPQYQSAARDIEDSQVIAVDANEMTADELAASARKVPGIVDAFVVPTLYAECSGPDGCLGAMVATCAQLHQLAPELTGCRDDEVAWLDEGSLELRTDLGGDLPDQLTWQAGSEDEGWADVMTTEVDLPTLDGSTRQSPYDMAGNLYIDAIIPPAKAGPLPTNTQNETVVIGPPGRDLGERLRESPHLPDRLGYMAPDYAEYDFVASLRSIVWSVAGLILVIGLLGYAVAAVDRAVERRKELVALQLLGTPKSVLRRAQWLEALVPIVVGSVLAVGLGALAGATYLKLEEGGTLPWAQAGWLALVAAGCGVVVAGGVVVASTPSIRADQIRRE